MKVSLALLILLLAAAWTGSQGISLQSPGGKCCSEKMFRRRKIPEFKIQDYQHTPSTCTHKAVFVKLKEGWVCVDPQKKWFQKYLKKQKEPNNTST